MLCNRKGDSGLLWNIQLMQIEKKNTFVPHTTDTSYVFSLCYDKSSLCESKCLTQPKLVQGCLCLKSGICGLAKFLSNTGNPFGSTQLSFVTHWETTILLVSTAAAQHKNLMYFGVFHFYDKLYVYVDKNPRL